MKILLFHELLHIGIEKDETENVIFKDIAVISDESDLNSAIYLEGYNREHGIKNVIFENISHNGKPLLTPDALNIKSNEFVDFMVL